MSSPALSQGVSRREANPKQCPRCASRRVHRSHRKNVFDRFLGAIGGEIRRCHDCRSRQVWFGSRGFLLGKEGMPGAFASAALALFTALVCFLFIWWMISRFTEITG